MRILGFVVVYASHGHFNGGVLATWHDGEGLEADALIGLVERKARALFGGDVDYLDSGVVLSTIDRRDGHIFEG